MKTVFDVEGCGNGKAPVRLRGHHFLCLLTYKGLGYTPGFVENMTAIAEAINGGTPVVLTHGPDDICNALDAEDRALCGHDCEKASVYWRDEEAVLATRPLMEASMDEPFVLDVETVKHLRGAFRDGTTRNGCEGCKWKPVCDAIAEEGFAGAVLFPSNAIWFRRYAT